MQPFRYAELYIILFHLLKKENKIVLLIFLSSIINTILKRISQLIFGLNNDYIPILGQGSRPFGAKNCGYINRPSTSFGFPSGHSQFASFYATLMILIISNKERLEIRDKIIITMLLLFVILMMASRVYNGCHTIEQTIFGALIGFVLGKLFYKMLYNG